MKRKKSKILKSLWPIIAVQICIVFYTLTSPDSPHLNGLSQEYIKGVFIGSTIFLWMGYLITLDMLTSNEKMKRNTVKEKKKRNKEFPYKKKNGKINKTFKSI